MPNLTVRLPEDLYRRVKERRDVNWAEVVRRAIISYLNQPLVNDKLDEYIWSLVKEGEWEKLRYLHMKTELLAEMYGWNYAKRNLEIMYPDKANEIQRQVNNDLASMGIDPRLVGYGPNNRRISEIVKDYMILHGVYDYFIEECKKRLSNTSWKVREAAEILSQYESTHIPLNGFLRTMQIYFDLDEANAEELINELVRVGLVYRDYYDSRAYSYPFLRLPDYAQDIINELADNVKITFNYYSEPNDLILFLKWMGGIGKYVLEYREDEEIKKELKEIRISIDLNKFKEIINKMVKGKILVIDYKPHRRRTGRRSSSPAMWIYKLTPAAKKELIIFILERLPNITQT